ncbi:hypothetical protein HanRHA438_Chr11g0486661 [Helianthus annuus]|nr:hypothetical protein HanRHA438_Chr11g0486661 [Helianthus annuus]
MGNQKATRCKKTNDTYMGLENRMVKSIRGKPNCPVLATLYISRFLVEVVGIA